MSSLYAKYLNERTGKGVIEKDYGFATYSFHANGVCYLEDIYIIPEKRNSKYATALANEVVMLAKSRQCGLLLGSVCLDSYGADTSIKVLQGYGMRVSHIEAPNMIYFKKEI